MTKEEYQSLETDEDIEEIFEAGTATTINVSQLAIDDLIAFKTVDGAFGVIHITNYEHASDGNITIDYKVSD